MLLTTRVVADSQIAFETAADIDGVKLIAAAEGRQDMARSRGAEWTAGAIPVFAKQFVEAAEQRYEASEVGLLATNLAMAAWLNDSIFGGVTAEAFLACDLVFTLGAEGEVSYARVPRAA